jgi:hypothetical protein
MLGGHEALDSPANRFDADAARHIGGEGVAH